MFVRPSASGRTVLWLRMRLLDPGRSLVEHDWVTAAKMRKLWRERLPFVMSEDNARPWPLGLHREGCVGDGTK